jgi:hypothetical protein
MARQHINRSGEMAVFVRVVELGGFSAAARQFCMTPSAVSKLVPGWKRGSASDWSTGRHVNCS